MYLFLQRIWIWLFLYIPSGCFTKPLNQPFLNHSVDFSVLFLKKYISYNMYLFNLNHFSWLLRYDFISSYIRWYVDWIWRFWIKKEEYSREEHLYLIRKNMGVSQGKFDMTEVKLCYKILIKWKSYWLRYHYKDRLLFFCDDFHD